MEMWNLENHIIEGTYHGASFKGRVLLSRGIGDAVAHLVWLAEPIMVCGDLRKWLIIKTSDDIELVDFKVIE